MAYLEAGDVYELTVTREIPTGYVLSNGKVDVLLHKNEVIGEVKEDQDVEVFLYHDKKGQLVATMTIPTVNKESYEWCSVVESVRNLGVFVNIGIQKDMLVSKDDLPGYLGVWPQKGDELMVTLITDNKGQLFAKLASPPIVEEVLEIAPETLQNNLVSGRVYHTDREGATIMSPEGYRGFIHHTESKVEPRLGEWVEGRVIKVKDDGTLNVSLRPVKEKGMVEDADEVLAFLKNQGGVMSFNDKSDPDAIRETFKISKAAFKRALGKLMKEKKIEQRDGKTFLVEE